MTPRYSDDLIDEFKYREALRDAREGALIDAAFADIIAGRFDSETVHEATRLGHHDDYHRLKRALDDAIRAARHSGVMR